MAAWARIAAAVQGKEAILEGVKALGSRVHRLYHEVMEGLSVLGHIQRPYGPPDLEDLGGGVFGGGTRGLEGDDTAAACYGVEGPQCSAEGLDLSPQVRHGSTDDGLVAILG